MKGVRASGAHGMPEGAELVLGSMDLEVDATLAPQLFRSDPLAAAALVLETMEGDAGD